jgi:hypothetical protein
MKTKDPTDPEFDGTVGRELRDLLSVDPAPGFKTRVRERIDGEPQPGGWNYPGIFATAGVIAAVVVAFFVFQSRGRNIQQGPGRAEVAGTTSQEAARVPIAASPPRESPLPHHRASKAARPEPQLIIAANEASALRRLLSGEVNELPGRFEPQVREFGITEAVVEPLAPPAPIAPAAPIAIDPIELLETAVPDIRR